MTMDAGAASLMRAVGLLADGPVLWGRPLTTRSAGVYLVELAGPQPTAPIDSRLVAKWLDRRPELRLDGERPIARPLVARLRSFWLPSETILYVGATAGSVGGRVLALAHHQLGDRRPHADGHWLHTLVGIERARVWWAETDAPQEYLDAILNAFALAASPRTLEPGGTLPGRPANAQLLPWANTRRPTGERQVHGITGAVAPDDTVPSPPTHVVNLVPGDAEGARTEVRGTGVTRRAPRAAPPAATTTKAPPRRATGASPAHAAAAARAARIAPVPITRDALDRLEVELTDLTQVRRRDVVARIKAAREHGDLKENAEYQTAREEQSFLEGRVRLLEERKRHAVLIEEVVTGKVALGSTVVVRRDDETFTYSIVGTTDADPAAGRISSSSPVGSALLGAVAGSDVDVRTPRGSARYHVIEVR